MKSDFAGTLRALEDPRRVARRATLGSTLGLVAAWVVWFAKADVTVYSTSAHARLETEAAVRPLEFEVSGRIRLVGTDLGQDVEAGQLLFDLEAGDVELRLAGERARRDAASAQLTALSSALRAEEAALRHDQAAAQRAKLEAKARLREATSKIDLLEKEATRANVLYAQHVLSERERDELAAAVRQQQAISDAIRSVADRIEYQRRTSAGDRQSALARLRQQLAECEAALSTAEANIARLNQERWRHQIRAPVRGRVGELAALKVGDRVETGTQAGSLVPDGGLRIVALFEPAAALGRVQVGQPAQLRLDGFPWTEYGSLTATVSKVADEARDGQIRVELVLARKQRPALPIQHGLTGVVDVATESVSPASLVIRKAGVMAHSSLSSASR